MNIKRFYSTFLVVCLLLTMTTLSVFAEEQDITTRGFGTYTGEFDTTVQIPAFTNSRNYHFDGNSLTYKTVYEVTYNLNTGEISKARILRHEFYSNQLIWPDTRVNSSSITNSYYNTTISSNKYSVTFSYGVDIGITYYDWVGGPSETKTYTFNKSKTVRPNTRMI